MSTTFVTGGSGFIGRVFVTLALASGRRVLALGRSAESCEALAALGAEPVVGDLSSPGAWQARLGEADELIHLAQPLTFGGRVSRARAQAYAEQRRRMDDHLLDAATAAGLARVLYVAGTSFYGDQGQGLVDETTTPNPRGWGPFIADAIAALDRRIAAGLPAVVAFPGYVYGPGSWFVEHFVKPIRAGKRLIALGGRSRMGSFIHVDDCAAALLHLLDHGALGQRVFVVDDRPQPWSRLHELVIAHADRPVGTRTLPRWLVTAMLGPIASASLDSDCCLSNARLRAGGFELGFSTIDEGVPPLVEAALATQVGEKRVASERDRRDPRRA